MWECRKGLRPRRPAMASVNPIMRSPANAPSTCPPVSAAKTKSGSGTMSTSAEPQTARSISIQEANSERPEHARTATSSGFPSADLACFATVVIASPRLVPFQLDPARGSAQRACDWLWGGLVENLVQIVGTALAAARCRLARNRLAIHLDRAQVNVPAGAMAAAGHQVHEPYFIHFTQVGIVDPNLIRGAIHAKRDHSIRIQLDPAHICQCELAHVEHGDGRVRAVSHEQSSIRELYNGPHLVEAGRLDHPPYSAQPGEVHVIILRPESDGKGPCAGARPHRERRAFASRCAGGEQFRGGGSVLFEFNIRIGDIFLNDRNLAVLARRPHPFHLED